MRGQNKPLYIGHPELEGFEVRQTVRRGDRGRLAPTSLAPIHVDDLRGVAPDLARHLDHSRKLRPFDVLRHPDVLGGAGREPALRAQA
jgi:hypothetical protein